MERPHQESSQTPQSYEGTSASVWLEDLRAEFDLADRYASMESKLRSIQQALELMLEVVRDRRLVLLEVAVVVLILAELIFTALRLL